MRNAQISKISIAAMIVLFAFTAQLTAQNLPAVIYGGPEDERAFALVEATSGDGYVLAGWTKSYGIGTPAFSNVLIVKTDSFGMPQGALMSIGNFDDEAYSMTQTLPDGGYAVTGWTKSYGFFPGDSSDIFVVKIDSAGNLQWGNVYGSPFCEEAYSIIQTMDGGYAVTGWTNLPTVTPTTPPNIFLLKLDSAGIPIWTGIYWFPMNLEDEGYSICEVPGVGVTDRYLIAGRAKIFDPTNFDAFVMQTDPGGMPISLASVVPGAGVDEAYSVLWGGQRFIAAGWSNSFGSGDADIIVWEDDTVMGTPAFGAHHFGWDDDEKVMDDRSLTGIPGHWSVSGWTKSVGPGIPNPNFLIIAYDTSGFSGRVHPSSPGANDEQAYPMINTFGGYAVAGFTNSSWSFGGDDFHLLTLDHGLNRPVCIIDTLPPFAEIPVLEENVFGEPLYFEPLEPFLLEEIDVLFTEICTIPHGVTEFPGKISPSDLDIYASFEYIKLQIKTTGRLDVYLYDLSGRKVASLAHGMYEKGTHLFMLPKNMSAGVYFVIADFGGIKKSVKLIRFR